MDSTTRRRSGKVSRSSILGTAVAHCTHRAIAELSAKRRSRVSMFSRPGSRPKQRLDGGAERADVGEVELTADGDRDRDRAIIVLDDVEGHGGGAVAV
jgi:hypothetical protein